MKQNGYEIRTIHIGEREIPYYYYSKKVKNINLRIKPDATVHVSASKSVPLDYVDKFVFSKAEFILKAIDKFRKNMEYIFLDEGEQIHFLGKPYTIRLQKRSKMGASLSFDNQEFYIFLRDTTNIKSRFEAFEGWQRFASQEVFPIILKRMLERFKEYPLQEPILRYRKMKSRWGSCHYSQNMITLSLMLTEVSVPAIEYVILHELVHFFHPNHSKNFYQMVEELMPDWRERQSLLRSHIRLNQAEL